MKKILAADIGGTNSRFASFSMYGQTISHDRSIWLSTSAANNFEHLLDLLASSNFELQPHKADAIVFGVAGPVLDGVKCNPPNIPWEIDLSRLPKKRCAKHTLLINDFTAQGYACFTPAYEDALEILEGTPVTTCPIAIIGAGTGLGKSLLVPDGRGTYVTVPSEGGHGAFPFTTKAEAEYADFVRTKTGAHKVTGDLVVSGSGLEHLYEFHTGEALPAQKVVAHFKDHPVVLEWFAGFYGRICQNFVLDTLALGGLYIAGGIAAGNPNILQHQAFETAFRDCKQYSSMLKNIPIKLNTNEEAGLWGAAQYGADHLLHK